jgi:hypothetical protein
MNVIRKSNEKKDGIVSSLPFCLDGRAQRPSPPRHLYIGATHPSNVKAKQVPINSAAEKAVLTILKSATMSEPGPHAREDLVEIVIEKLENGPRANIAPSKTLFSLF